MSETAKRYAQGTLGPDDGSAAEDRSGSIGFRQRKRQALASSSSSKQDPEDDSCKSEKGASDGNDVDLAWSLEAGLAHISSEECGLGELVKVSRPFSTASLSLSLSLFLPLLLLLSSQPRVGSTTYIQTGILKPGSFSTTSQAARQTQNS